MIKIDTRLKQTSSIFLALFFCLLIAACLAPKSFENNDRPGGVYSPDVRAILEDYHPEAAYPKLSVLYPYDESIFPPDMAAPTFKWTEEEAGTTDWLVMVTFDNGQEPLFIECVNPHWTPTKERWERIKQNSIQGPAQISILGVKSRSRPEVVSKGSVKISTSRDPVAAPVMFRRVPPSFAYASQNPELMEWCLGDISSYEEPPVIMSDQTVCASCHTFSQGGRSFGMDVDYRGDKGAYALTNVREDITLTDQDFMSWNDFPRNDGLISTGLFSRISPDGNHVVSTVNEINFLARISDPYCSQLFYPIQGHLAFYSKEDRKIYALTTGTEQREIVDTHPAWSPDGDHILFARATMTRDLFVELGGKTIFTAEQGVTVDQLNRQYPVQFDVYRVPFNKGGGGQAEPLPGASLNGKSNYCARYSPNGKWIVFTQSATGLAIQPDSKLYLIPSTGGEAKLMRCNRGRVNSWHTWSPNGKWLAFVSKENSPYTELFLTHIDDNGKDSPPILLQRFNKPGYAINVPEFANIPSGGIQRIAVSP